ncbi:RCC1 domain-containing protein, partial [Gammaproteobacteria bacterium]|nr:RCC1 domain-containing protein [Gammaproteobacteria bacterium]
MKLVHYHSLIFLLLVTSPTLLASVPVSIDTDGDGIEDSQDADDDGDGVADSQDAFPLDSRYSKDSDSDGLPDKWETANGLNPEDGSDASSDQDGDGLDAAREFSIGTFANRRDSDRDTLPDGWEVDNVRNPKLADYQVASADGYHTCALDDNGVQCWGSNSYGETN